MLHRGQFLTLWAHARQNSMCPQGMNTVDMLESMQSLHSQSARDFCSSEMNWVACCSERD